MSWEEILKFLAAYGGDCLALALAVCALTALLKWKCPAKGKKFFTFLPFLIGIALRIGIEAVRQKGFSMLPYTALVTEGFRCGGLSTILYVLYEQFLRRRKTPPNSPAELAATGILAERVQHERLAPLASEIAAAATQGTDEGTLLSRLQEILKEDLPDECDRTAVCTLLLEVLRAL